MRSKTRAVIAFAASAVGFALVGFLFDLAFSMSPPPVVLPDRVEIGVVAVLITTLTTVFGVGSMRRPLASLAGIMMLTAIGPIELCGPPATLMFVWTSWLMGALLHFPRFRA